MTLLQIERASPGGWHQREIAGVEISITAYDKAARLPRRRECTPRTARTKRSQKADHAYANHKPYTLVGMITRGRPAIGADARRSAELMAGCAVLSQTDEFTPLVWRMTVDGWKSRSVRRTCSKRLRVFGATGAALVDWWTTINVSPAQSIRGRHRRRGRASRQSHCGRS